MEDGEVTITTFNESGGRSESHGALGDVKTPTGETVKETSAYGKVTFDLQSLIGGEPIGKSRDLYCTLEINSEESYEAVSYTHLDVYKRQFQTKWQRACRRKRLQIFIFQKISQSLISSYIE